MGEHFGHAGALLQSVKTELPSDDTGQKGEL